MTVVDLDTHRLAKIGKSRGDRGKRTVAWGYCSCGYGIGRSVNVASVERKHAEHVAKVSPCQ